MSGGSGAYAVTRDEGSEPARLVPRPLALTADEERIVQTLLAALRRIQYGSVQLIVQDNRVVQIDTVEKTRLTSA